jgi:hypothetical protein
MMLFHLQMLLSVVLDREMIMNGEYVRIWKVVVFQVIVPAFTSRDCGKSWKTSTSSPAEI